MNTNAKNMLAKTIEKIHGAYSPGTIRAYRVDFSDFIQFCDGVNELALPAQPQSVVWTSSSSSRIAVGAQRVYAELSLG